MVFYSSLKVVVFENKKTKYITFWHLSAELFIRVLQYTNTRILHSLNTITRIQYNTFYNFIYHCSNEKIKVIGWRSHQCFALQVTLLNMSVFFYWVVASEKTIFFNLSYVYQSDSDLCVWISALSLHILVYAYEFIQMETILINKDYFPWTH